MSDNPIVQLIEAQAQWVKSRQDNSSFSLNYETYLKEEDKIEEQTERFKRLKDFQNVLSFKSLPSDQLLIQKDSILKEKRVRWEESLAKDIYVDEAINVLSDLSQIKRTIHPIAQIK